MRYFRCRFCPPSPRRALAGAGHSTRTHCCCCCFLQVKGSKGQRSMLSNQLWNRCGGCVWGGTLVYYLLLPPDFYWRCCGHMASCLLSDWTLRPPPGQLTVDPLTMSVVVPVDFPAATSWSSPRHSLAWFSWSCLSPLDVPTWRKWRRWVGGAKRP